MEKNIWIAGNDLPKWSTDISYIVAAFKQQQFTFPIIIGDDGTWFFITRKGYMPLDDDMINDIEFFLIPEHPGKIK